MQGCWFNGLTQLRHLSLHMFAEMDDHHETVELHFDEFPPQLCDISVNALHVALKALPYRCTEKTVLRINTLYLNVLGIVPGNATLGENLELHLLAANILVPSSHAEKQLKLISCTLPPRLDAFLPSICHHPLEHYSGRHIYHGDGGWFCNGAVPQL